MSHEEQAMSKDKYPSIFSPQMETTVFIYPSNLFRNARTFKNLGIFNSYSPKWRWLGVDIYRAAKRRGKHQPLATDTEYILKRGDNKYHQQLIWMISSLVTDANRTPFSPELLGGK